MTSPRVGESHPPGSVNHIPRVGAAQTPKMTDFRPFYKIYKLFSHPKCSHVLAVHWRSHILRFTFRPRPGSLQTPAPEGRILAPRTWGNLGVPLERPTISVPGWQAGWGTSLGTLRVPLRKLQIIVSYSPPPPPMDRCVLICPPIRILDRIGPAPKRSRDDLSESISTLLQTCLDPCLSGPFHVE
jgi:hypothetical protein